MRMHTHYSEISAHVVGDMGLQEWGEDDLSSLES